MNLKEKLATIGFADAVHAGAAEDDDYKKAENDDENAAASAEDDDNDGDEDKKAKKAKSKAKKAKAADDDEDKKDDDEDAEDEDDKKSRRARGSVSHRSIQMAERVRIADIFDAAASNGHGVELAAELAFGTDLDAKAATRLLNKLAVTGTATTSVETPLAKAMAHIPAPQVPSVATKQGADKTGGVIDFIMAQTGKHPRSRYDW